MMIKPRITFLISIFIIVFSAGSLIKAQDPAAQGTPTDAQTDEQKQKEKDAAEKKAAALLDQIVGEVQAFSRG